MMDDSQKALQKIGLNDKEARVYLALLSLGQGSASAIARSSGLKRPTTYVILDDLRQRGLALKMPGSKKQMFSAQSPEELLSEMKKSVTEVEMVLPELLNSYSRSTPRVRTIHFEGLVGMREAMWYRVESLRGKEIVAFFGSSEGASSELVALFHVWNEAMAKQETKLRSLVPDDKSLKQFREKDLVYNFLPRTLPKSVYTSQTSIEITDTFVRILMFQEQQATIIENPKVARALLEIFEIVWNSQTKITISE